MITMLSSNLSLFSLVTFLCICLCVGNFHAKKCAETDRLALLKLKDGFIDELNSLNSWNGEDCCQWKGISCDNLTAYVTDLNLSDSLLKGKLDSSICELKHLTFFHLSDNEVEGVIPNCIGSLVQLIELNLGYNKLVGGIPPTLGNLSNLETLYLPYNFLLANDLEWVSRLSTLKYLDLSHVHLSQSADWLSSMSKIPSLSELRLDGCGIGQVIPKSIRHINSSTSLKTLSLSNNLLNSSTLSLVLNVSKVLTYLDLSSNSLQHNIPDGFVNMVSLSHLRYLYLSGNELEGNILKYVPTFFQLTELRLDGNKLSGKPVDYVRQLCSAQDGLEVLVLGNNPFSSALFPDFSCFSFLKTLSLQSSNITGSLSQSFSKLALLEELDLSDNHLNGTLPSAVWQLSSLRTLVLSSNELNGIDVKSHLSNLSHLYLRDNQLSGSQPLFEISKLASLEELDLSDNQLNGTLPSTIWQLSSLRRLALSSNKLIGVDVIHESLLSNLSYLDITDNQLSGSQTLFEIIKLASLEELYLSNNQLNGTLPCNIGGLSNLTTLYLSSNKLNGVVNESHLSNLSQLEYLNVAGNALTFNFNSNWVPPFQLHGLVASSCILGPKFPTWLRNQIELGDLDISNSGISDSFPNWFWNLSSRLSYLNVSHNKISGALPLSLPSTKGNSMDRFRWDLSFNNLSGPLAPFPELDTLLLSNNMFSGFITSFCATPPTMVTILDLSSNLLAGTLPDCWGKFQSLIVLNLAKNNLSGRIPKSFATLRQIESINLNSNNFSGEIPSMSSCSSLQFIDFGNNNLQGTLPAWAGHNLRQLMVLRLEANKFNGSIPTSLCNLLYLQVLDLSNNNITGEIPQCLSRIIVLSNVMFLTPTFSHGGFGAILGEEISRFLDKAMLEWKGQDQEYEKNLGLMTIIDLSCNQLTGEIPKSITTLAALAGLNLSRNNLTGFIPDKIGHMKMLESLDLSRNHLYGRMPTSLSNLTFLSYMDLSFNNLSGKIPKSTQLQTFDASAYKGNSGLCGPPLPNRCLDAVSPNGSIDENSVEEDGDEDELITIGFYITLGFGFCVGFWSVCGTLIIKSSWRRAYFQFFNNLNDWICVTLAVFVARMKRKFQVQD
ncbi:receptor-like protein EIX1 [Abrus precatorius]|uniref:Receptor-like protein EIX1 n=1 Tax=Abrus precatorius TaxID=3816 RepID=A0A8B8LV23_ABRPR|nr:receptor-like protein EIX1 [Abrus precatorius]